MVVTTFITFNHFTISQFLMYIRVLHNFIEINIYILLFFIFTFAFIMLFIYSSGKCWMTKLYSFILTGKRIENVTYIYLMKKSKIKAFIQWQMWMKSKKKTLKEFNSPELGLKWWLYVNLSSKSTYFVNRAICKLKN